MQLRVRDAYRFFLPLVLMTELNMISKSVIHAFLARTSAPSVALAAFNTSFTFYYTIAAATEVTTILAIGYLENRVSFPRLIGFLSLVLLLPVAIAWAAAFTPLGGWLYGEVFGLSATAVQEAKLATFVFSLSAPVLVVRGIAFALLMRNRRTIFITWSTLVRLLSLALSLTVWPLVASGAVIGAAALVTCMAFEAAFAWCFAARHYVELPVSSGSVPRMGELWRFVWPLVFNQSSEMGLVFVVNLFLGRLSDPVLALAAFGVVHGLVSLLMSPMRNLVQTAQTLGASRASARTLTIFTLQLAAFFTALALVLFDTPLSGWVLGTVMGLTPTLEAYCAVAMKATFCMAVFWALAALFRGLLAGERDTLLLAVTGCLRLLVACALSALALSAPGINGALLGLTAWIFAYAIEALVLGLRLRRPARFAPS